MPSHSPTLTWLLSKGLSLRWVWMWTRRESKTTWPRPVKLDGTDEDTKLLGALVHWVMCNNLLTIVNKYPAIQASRDFDVSYGKLRRVITGKRQPERVVLWETTLRTGGREKWKEAQGCEPSGHSLGKEEEGNTVSWTQLNVSIVVSCITQVKSSRSTLTRNTQASKLSMLVRSVPNHLISIQSICST